MKMEIFKQNTGKFGRMIAMKLRPIERVEIVVTSLPLMMKIVRLTGQEIFMILAHTVFFTHGVKHAGKNTEG